MSEYRKTRAVGRREIIKTTLTWTTLAGSPVTSTLWAKSDLPSKRDGTPPQKSKNDSARIDLDMFMKISLYFTETSSLSREIGAKILATFMDDPRYQSSLFQLAQMLPRSAPSGEKAVTTPTQFLRSEGSLAPIVKEILGAWYLGIRTVGEKTYFFTYFDALIFQTTNSLRSIPGTCGGPTHFWSEPPLPSGS